MGRVGNGYRLCMLGDLNGWSEDRVRASITGAFGVPKQKDNGRRVVESFAERGCECVTRTLSTRVCISTQEWRGTC